VKFVRFPVTIDYNYKKFMSSYERHENPHLHSHRTIESTFDGQNFGHIRYS